MCDYIKNARKKLLIVKNNDFRKVRKVEKKNKVTETKNILIQYRKINTMIRHLESKLDEKESSLMGCKSGKLTGMPRGGAPVTIADALADKVDLERRIEKLRIVAIQKKEIVQSYIDTVLSPRHNDFLTMYYIKCMSVEDIAKTMPCSVRHAWRLYREGIRMVDISIDL